MAPRIMLAMIVYDGISPETMKSLAPLLVQPGIMFADWNRDGLVSRGRSFLASRFLEGDCDVLLEIDSDIGFSYLDALEIAGQSVTHDIVAGVYVGRRFKTGNLPTTYFLPGTPVEFGKPGEASHEPVEVLFPAGGFRATHRRVFERLAQRDDMPVCHASAPGGSFRPFYMPFPWTEPSGEVLYLSEDFALVARAREEGFKAYVNPAVRLTHVARTYFRLEDGVPNAPPEVAAALRREPQQITFEQVSDRALKIRVGDDEQAAEKPEAVLPPGVSV